MKRKRILAAALAVAIVFALCLGLTACKKEEPAEEVVSFNPIEKKDFKLGVICLHDDNSTYDKNFIDAVEKVKKEFGLQDSQVILKTGIQESNNCYETAADLVDQGCDVVFADSFGHEPFMAKAAKEFPKVRFCHATGTSAHTELQGNFYNAFASIYEGRYLAGVAAGMKLNDMAVKGGTAVDGKAKGDDAHIGYVGAFTYAEVISGLTSFYLGVKSVCPAVTMDVKFTGSWYDETKERTTADDLIANHNCVLISQHADSMGAPTVCEEKGVPNVTYNVSTENACPKTYLIGSKINWAPYFRHIIECALNGVTALGFDWVGTIATDSVQVLELNENIAAPGTKEKLEEVKSQFVNGTLKVYDINTFTLDKKPVDSYVADVDSDKEFKPDTNVIKTADGTTFFAESEYRSAPYFDLRIDGITYLNSAF